MLMLMYVHHFPIFSLWNDDGLELARPAMVDHKISLASLIVPQHVHTFPYQWIGLREKNNRKPWVFTMENLGFSD